MDGPGSGAFALGYGRRAKRRRQSGGGEAAGDPVARGGRRLTHGPFWAVLRAFFWLGLASLSRCGRNWPEQTFNSSGWFKLAFWFWLALRFSCFGLGYFWACVCLPLAYLFGFAFLAVRLAARPFTFRQLKILLHVPFQPESGPF